jgi:DNA modification methylase
MQEDETVDLIYLDPPFQSGKDYNLLFVPRDRDARPRAQVKVFEDTWDWNESASAAYHEVLGMGRPISVALETFHRFLGSSKMLAYLSMMSVRLFELHRVLKPTGSLYVHCDPSASHYLKVILDAIFGPDSFRNELIWKRTNAHNSAKRYGPVYDVIFFYTKTASYTWNPQFMAYSEKYLKKFRKIDPLTGKPFREVTLTGPGVRAGDSGKTWGGWNVTQRGRHWQPATYVYTKYLAITGTALNTYPLLKRLDELDRIGMIYWPNKKGGEPCYKFFLEDAPGVPLQDVWTDIDAINSQAVERLGYPTQKPIELMERIILASSNEGDLVLDPFCGCGTTIHAAHRHRRRWIGIDISSKAEENIAKRLNDEFGEIARKTYDIQVEPQDLESAAWLAENDRHQFQRWALTLVGVPSDEIKKGADGGIDGVLHFQEAVVAPVRKIIFSVKSGHHKVSDVRDLRGVMDREKAAIGVVITLHEPTKPMIKEAADAGFYSTTHAFVPEKFPRIQILTVGDLLDGARIKAPLSAVRKGPKRAVAPQKEFAFMQPTSVTSGKG